MSDLGSFARIWMRDGTCVDVLHEAFVMVRDAMQVYAGLDREQRDLTLDLVNCNGHRFCVMVSEIQSVSESEEEGRLIAWNRDAAFEREKAELETPSY